MTQDQNEHPESGEPVLLDLYAVLQDKMGKKSRLVPKWLVRWLERVICIDDLNRLLRANYPKRGAEFCSSVLADLGGHVKLAEGSQWPDASHGRIIVVSNHPMGGLEGLAIITLMVQHYGPGVKVIVNDILSAVDPLSDIFLPVNKHGKQSRDDMEAIARAMEGDDPIVVFPAGFVSRLQDDGEVRDERWFKMFVTKAIQYRRDVLPIHFSGHLSSFFYKLARRRRRLGIKLNIEMVYLPREMIYGKCRDFTIRIGKLIPWQELKASTSHSDKAQEIRAQVYAMGK